MTDAATIKAELTATETPDEVEAVAAKYREAVRAMSASDDPEQRLMATHIVNLKKYMLWSFK